MSIPLDIRGSANIAWMYPEIYGQEKPKDVLKIELYHVRAALGIEVEYDSDKDGWEIYSTNENNERKLTAFIPAWPDEESK